MDIYNERDLFKTEEPATEEEEESASDGERTLDGELDLLEQDPLVPPPPSQAPLSAERVAFPKGKSSAGDPTGGTVSKLNGDHQDGSSMQIRF